MPRGILLPNDPDPAGEPDLRYYRRACEGTTKIGADGSVCCGCTVIKMDLGAELDPALRDNQPRFLFPISLASDLRAALDFAALGIVVISARSTVFTDSGVVKTLEMSGSRSTMRRALSILPAKRFRRAFR